MKVLGFVGSPRKNFNTEKLVNEVLEGAKTNGAETKLYNLSKMNIQGCNACRACKEKGVCVIDDDMQEVVKEMRTADAIVVGSPVYMYQMTGYTKTFIDRLYPIIKSDFSTTLKEGAKAVLIFTQGQADTEKFRAYFDHNEKTFQLFGFSVEKTLVAGGTREKNDVVKNEEVMGEAKNIGANL